MPAASHLSWPESGRLGLSKQSHVTHDGAMASPYRQTPPAVGTLVAGFPFEGVVGMADHGKGKQEIWRLRCSCGEFIEKKAGYLKGLERAGLKPRCDNWSLNHFKGKIGDKYNLLTLRRLAVEDYVNGKNGLTTKVLYAYCDCDCGAKNIRGAAGNLIKAKGTWLSCGCKRASSNRERNTTHGKSGSKEFELFHNARKRAREDNLPFDIEISDIAIPEFCPVLGIKIEANSGGSRMKDSSPTLDKFYPAKGYVKGNIQVISWRANRMKSDGTPEDWIKIAKWCQQEDVRRRLTGDS